MTGLFPVEESLLQAFAGGNIAGAIFILGAPRTGSTLLYQAMAKSFGLPYISNLTNSYLADTPIIGLAMQNGLRSEISFESAFGKTSGPLQPSEGSAVMTNWFGGGHPSQLVSTRIRDGMEVHFLRTLAATEAICHAPLLIKNAWHSFRVPYLAETLPGARFVWIRRDIREAAQSDLAARYATKGDGNAWNSATPANVEILRHLSAPQQVVENQFEFNSAIEIALRRHAPGRWVGVWYEDFVAAPEVVLSRIGGIFSLEGRVHPLGPIIAGMGARKLAEQDRTMIRDYVTKNMERLDSHIYRASGNVT